MPMPTPIPIPHESRKILVLGAGNFGSCLADHLADSEHQVLLWSRDAEQITYFNEHHRNNQYLQDHTFSENIRAVGPELPAADTFRSVDVVLFAIPTEGVRRAV